MDLEEENIENIENIENNPPIIINDGIISESDLFDIYENQYNDLFSKILIISEEEFFSLLQEQVLINLRLINKLSDLSLMSFFQELISERYKQDKEKAENNFKLLEGEGGDKIFLDVNNCYIHCLKNLEIKHKCGNELILFNDFIFCLNCKKVYSEALIKLYCSHCDKIFFSKKRNDDNNILLNEQDDEDILYPAFFSEVHSCQNFNENKDNEIKCLECNNQLYFNLAENDQDFLVCVKCKLIFDTKKIKFKCNFCGENFPSKAKIINAFDEQKINMIFLIHTLRKEKSAFPHNIDRREFFRK